MDENQEVKIHCREKFQQRLTELLDDQFLPPSIYIFGNTSVGKTFVVRSSLEHQTTYNGIYVNCIECTTSRQLFEEVIYSLTEPIRNVETVYDFLYELQAIAIEKFVIVLDNAERLRDMEANILPVFLELQQLTGLNVSVIFISQLRFEKFHTKENSEQPILVYVPNYSKEEIDTILINAFKPDVHPIENSQELYADYLNIFLNTFFKACRDLKELEFMAQKFFPQYYQPILDGSIDRGDSQKLWRHIAKPLKAGMGQIYLRFVNIENNTKIMPKNYDLPYYAKYLLIAGFLASHNEAKDDKRLFMKNHGKKRKRAQDVNKIKVADKSKLVLGPKAFSVDRLLAIFYAILDEKVPMTCNLAAQISTLNKLRLFKVVSGESNILDGGMKIQSGVGLEFIMHLSRSLSFEIKPYLATLA